MSATPIFVATFQDQETVRLSCWQKDSSLDLHRGLKLAHSAYVTRKRNAARSTSLTNDDVLIPPIIAARFEDTSEPAVVLARYDAREIREAGLERTEKTAA